ncbi:hypothetical protein MQM1_058 [Aeromonas phage vB_AsaP_MQM1]|nr:hypothetical protein MQM1_058 [Aeromonas phage vB_AsaP_MQM1]
MAKYQVHQHYVVGEDGRVNFSETRSALRGFNLEAKWDSKADGHSENVQLRDVADGSDYFLLAKRYKVPGGFILIAKADGEHFMVSRGTLTDWDGRYAIKVTQKELDKLFK